MLHGVDSFLLILSCQLVASFGQTSGDYAAQITTTADKFKDATSPIPGVKENSTKASNGYITTFNNTTEEEGRLFLVWLFEKYGQGDVMTFEGFEHLLHNLGIGKLDIADHVIQDHYQDEQFVSFHESHDHNATADDGHKHNDHHANHENNLEHHANHENNLEHHSNHENNLEHHSNHENNLEHHANHDHDENYNHHDENHINGDKTTLKVNENHVSHEDEHLNVRNSIKNNSREHERDEHVTTQEVIHADKNKLGTPDQTLDDHDENLEGFPDSTTKIFSRQGHTSTPSHSQRGHIFRDEEAETLTGKDLGVYGKPDGPTVNSEIDKTYGRHGKSEILPATTSNPGNDYADTYLIPWDNGQENQHNENASSHEDNKNRNDSEVNERPALKKRSTTGRHEIEKKCLTAHDILQTFHISIDKAISQDDFLHLCPAIIYQIDAQACHDGDHHSHLGTPHLHEEDGSHRNISKLPIPAPWIADIKVWGYALASIGVISLVGLLSVAIIPIIQKCFFNYIIQFLVALAIGTLTGDALLHLLPHALGAGDNHQSSSSEQHNEHNHDSASEGEHSHSIEPVLKGLVVLGGIYTFFIMERLLHFCSEYKTKRRKRVKSKPQRHKSHLESVGEKLSQYNMDARSSDDILMVLNSTYRSPDASRMDDTIISGLESDVFEEERQYMMKSLDDNLHRDGSSPQPHGHSHGAKVPKSVASIAWMVIMGDGLHNFSDGIAIGAAFANGITGGISTTIAVFCHELPHEIGDFAVLLKAGMSIKQALFYNVVSSILAVLGMVIGVALGNIGDASLWIFAVAGGMFIYISLVDMLPEINGPVPSGDSRTWYTILQILGISTGVSIMLTIAIFEDRIKNIFG